MSSKEMLIDAIIANSKLSKKETARQQKIVEAAITLFAEKGYANTSTNEIAKLSGVAEGTIFRHYGTKENLLLSIILPFLRELMPVLAKDLMNQINAEKFMSIEDFLRAFIKNRMCFIKENREIFQIVVKELLYREELRNEILPLIHQDIFRFLSETLDKYKARGDIADIPTPTLIRMIFVFIASHFSLRFIIMPGSGAVDEDAEIEGLIRFIMNGVKRH